MADVPYHVYEHLANIWETIEYAEVMQFPKEIEKARAAGNKVLADALLVGKAKNDVLLRLVRNSMTQLDHVFPLSYHKGSLCLVESPCDCLVIEGGGEEDIGHLKNDSSSPYRPSCLPCLKFILWWRC
jgi:hypothetical protein